MPRLILKAIEAHEVQHGAGDDDLRLDVNVDGGATQSWTKDLGHYERWNLNLTFDYTSSVRIRLWEEDSWPNPDDALGDHTVGVSLVPRDWLTFDQDGVHHDLWYEVIDASVGHDLGSISLRRYLELGGRGALTQSEQKEVVGDWRIWRAQQAVSLRQLRDLHDPQDGSRSVTSVRGWVDKHCNPYGDSAVLPLSSMPEARGMLSVGVNGNYDAVGSEESRVFAGLVEDSYHTNEDNPFAHDTLDWNWDQFPDPSFHYMLAYSAYTRKPASRRVPRIHNEWENGSMPVKFRPFAGEHLTCVGRHIYDMGHFPMRSEMHPAHTMIRRRTHAAKIGANSTLVPANRATVGMGISGGFPEIGIGGRWTLESGGVPSAIGVDQNGCWITDLRKRKVKFRMYPPVARPSATATLNHKVVVSQLIRLKDWDKANDFLDLCQNENPALGGDEFGFRIWNKGASKPPGFVPISAPTMAKPKVSVHTDHNGTPLWLDVEIDLSGETKLPAGYYAIIDCGWSERASNTDIYRFDVTWDSVKAISTAETWNDWHLYFGVNGVWGAWWTDDFVREGHVYDSTNSALPSSPHSVYTIDDMPLVIRDAGIEWNGVDYGHQNIAGGNTYLDRVMLDIAGPNHMASITALANSSSLVSITNALSGSTSDQTVGIRAKGEAKFSPAWTQHHWDLQIRRRKL